MKKMSKRSFYFCNRPLQLIISIVLCFVAVSCAKQTGGGRLFVSRDVLPAAITAQLVKAEGIKTIKAIGKGEMTVKGRKKNFDFAVVAVPPYLLRVEFIDALTGDGTVMVSTPEEPLSGVKDLPFTATELAKILTGNVPHELDIKSKYCKDGSGGYWIGEEAVIMYDAAAGELTFRKMKNDKVLASVRFSDIKKSGKNSYPSVIQITVPAKKAELQLNYTDVELNKKIEKGVFYKVQEGK